MSLDSLRATEGNLSGYDRKKYVCKLLYIFILGWDIDFGHIEAVNLLNSSKYTEKQIVRILLFSQLGLLALIGNHRATWA